MNYQLLLNTNRQPSMSANNTPTSVPVRPPLSLKRTLQEHNSLRRDPFKATPSLQLSRQTNHSTRTLPPHPLQPTDRNFPAKESEKDTVSSLNSSSEDSSCNNGANIERVQEKMSETIDEDMKLSIRTKQKKSYYHKYEEREDPGTIWVSQPKWIPKQVKQAYESCANNLRNNQKVNFLQGFLNEIGFMYYVVERAIFFYDIQTINQDSSCRNIVEVQQKLVNAFYGIQVIDIGPPYISRRRKTLLFLHIYQAELYHFCIVKDPTRNNGRMLQIKSLNIRYSVANIKPSKFVLSKRGIMYYADDKGGLQHIQYDQPIISRGVSQIYQSSRKITQQIKVFCTQLAKNMSKSINSFVKTISNFSKTLFRSRALSTSLLYDEQRNLLILIQKRIMKDNFCQQELKIYNQEYRELLYSISHDELLDKGSTNEKIIELKFLEERLNNDYNIVAVLDSGKRIFYDINVDSLRKSVTYQSPPTNSVKYFTQNTHNNHSVQSSIVQQTYFASLIYSNSNYSYNFVRQQIYSKYEVAYKLDVQIHGAPRQNEYYMFSRQPQELGPLKHCLISSQDKSIKVKDMNLQVQQTFYRPQEIIHASDKMIQRIIILRPVDIFFAIVSQFQNLGQINKAFSIIFAGIKCQQIIRLSCQVLLDQEGVYYVSSRLILNLKVKLSIRIDDYERRNPSNQLNQLSFREMPKQTRTRIEELIRDIANQSSKTSKQQKQTRITIGFIKYLAKLFRTMWFCNINDMDRQVCRASIQIIQSFKRLISKIKKQMRCADEGMLSIAYRWSQRVRQLMILIMSIPKLPSKTFKQIVLAQPQQFHQYIFDFLIRYCKPQLSQQLKGSIPIYVNDSFLKIFRLWLTLKQMKSVQQKLRLCKEQPHLPDYFIDYISKERGLQEIRLLTKKKQTELLQIKQHFDNITSYKQILKCLIQEEGGFIEKQLLLRKAEQKLRIQAKYSETLFNDGMAQIGELATQIKLQRLIKHYYMMHKDTNTSWIQKLTSCIKLSNKQASSSTDQISNILQHFILDSQKLSQLVLQTKDDLLDIAYANQYMQYEVVDKIRALITKTVDSVATVRDLPAIFKQHLRYFMQTAKIRLQTEVIAKLYIEGLSGLQGLIDIMKSEEGILDQPLYFPLSYCVQIRAETQKMLRWAVKTLNQSDRNSPYFLYLAACSTYLVRNFIPSKAQQLQPVLVRGGHNEPILKKLIALLSDKNN